jgi:hypothetical protein
LRLRDRDRPRLAAVAVDKLVVSKELELDARLAEVAQLRPLAGRASDERP